MFSVTGNPTWFRRIGLWVLLCQLNVFIFCFPPFQTGIWVQTEPTVLALFISCTLSALWLAVGTAKRWLNVRPDLSSLLVCLLVWIAWQCLMTAGAQMPWRSWFGPPQTGDGTAMSIATLLMALMALALWEIEDCRRAILMTAGASVLVQCGLHLYYQPVAGNIDMPDRWIPAQWPDYLPFIGGNLWVAAWIGGGIKTHKQFGLLAIAMVVMLVDSHNLTAQIFFSLALVIITAERFSYLAPHLQHYFLPNPTWRRVMMAACFIPFITVMISPWVPAVGSDEHPSGAFSVFSRINDGLGARMIMNRVSVATLQHEPKRWLIGNGWGTYTDDLFKYGLVDGVYTYKNGQRAPNWFLVEGTSHHSHNQAVEALLSLGLIGILLWYAIPMLAIRALPDTLFWNCAPVIVALTGVAHFWFPLPQCFPYQALYTAALLSVCVSPKWQTPALMRACYTPLLAALALIMATSGYWHYRAMIHADQLHSALLSSSYKNYSEDWVAEDLRYGADRWATSARFYATQASNKSAKHELNDNVLGWYTYLMHVARKASQDPNIGVRASNIELFMSYYLFGGFDDPIFDGLRHEATGSFENAVIHLMDKAPLRDDYTTFFLLNLAGFTHNDIARQQQILYRMLAIAPQHRGALWLLGRQLMASPDKADIGRKMAQKALVTHAEKVFPIPDGQLKPAQRELGL